MSAKSTQGVNEVIKKRGRKHPKRFEMFENKKERQYIAPRTFLVPSSDPNPRTERNSSENKNLPIFRKIMGLNYRYLSQICTTF